MAVVYLTFDSQVDLNGADEASKKFKNALTSSHWTIAEFSLDKNEIKVFHNEFFTGAHYVEGDEKRKYVIKGIVKMTVKPKLAELLLSGQTQWVLKKVKVTHDDDPSNMIDLSFEPANSDSIIAIEATLDKPSK